MWRWLKVSEVQRSDKVNVCVRWRELGGVGVSQTDGGGCLKQAQDQLQATHCRPAHLPAVVSQEPLSLSRPRTSTAPPADTAWM